MLKKIAQRLAFGRASWDPVAYWRTRAADPDTMSVMWANLAFNELVDRDEWDVIASSLPERRGAVLDLGCGTGRMSQRLAAEFDAYTGVDLDTMVAEAARRNPELEGRYVAATVDDYDYPESAFDFVLSLGCLATACTVESLERVAPRIARSVRPGGRLTLIEPFHQSKLLTRGCKTTPERVTALFERHGLRSERSGGILLFPARMVLSEKVFERFPRVTRLVYESGERVARRLPGQLADYAVLVLSKPLA
ncbi:MAG: class I SAM-dependent methyltransferase [Myxococcales bacterium]|nr:class I SAM-dependent methyltransferase [Myxococcales bacterium]